MNFYWPHTSTFPQAQKEVRIRMSTQVQRIDFAIRLHPRRWIPNAGKIAGIEGRRVGIGLRRYGLLRRLSKCPVVHRNIAASALIEATTQFRMSKLPSRLKFRPSMMDIPFLDLSTGIGSLPLMLRRQLLPSVK